MRPTIVSLCIAAAAAAAPQAAVAAEGAPLSIRNDSGTSLSCQLAKKGSARNKRVVLRKGQDWSYSADSAMTIWCEPPLRSKRYHLLPGRQYRAAWDPKIHAFAIMDR